jgi:hypothetical protein
MRKLFTLVACLLIAVSLVGAQTRTTAIIDELNNFATVRANFNTALSLYGVGQEAFLTTATIDSFTVAGLTANGIVSVCIQAGSPSTLPVAGDLLAVVVGTGASGVVSSVYVTRAVGTTSGLKYWWKVEKW